MRIFMLAVICLVVISCSKGTDQAPADVNNGADTTAVAGRTKASARTNIDGIDTVTFHVTDSTVTLRATGFPQPTGRVVNVMVTGVDSRLGDPMGHADASRQAYSSGDFQRVYNQGQFMRQVMLRAFDNTDDFVGELGLRAALALVETNMTYDACEKILDDLRSHGFSSEDPTRIWVRLKPSLITKLKVYSFDSANVTEINKQISQKIGRSVRHIAIECARCLSFRTAG
ncbi:MAG: hypothetical protein IPH49_12755 [Ignavibacteria bacterium]|nr:hypothetical protein [Ignavibacteria bacterium]